MITIGIDTGGTCTDAVVYDTKEHQVLSWSKTLTTKKDLKEGILKALKGLAPEEVKKASCISLSTTLATNACVEGKGGRAKLVMIGVKPAMIEKMAGEYGLPPASEIYFMEGDAARAASGRSVDDWDQPGEKAAAGQPDWDAFRQDVARDFGVYDSVAVVQINPKYNDGAYEKQAEDIIREILGIPCVRGYDLYQEINVQKRGATALLNAKLLPVMNLFFASVDRSLAEMGLSLPVQVVKSDGSIMSRDYAVSRPVETLLCGPAASVIGALELCSGGACGEADAETPDCAEAAETGSGLDALIVDMGGTTSDVALVKGGTPVTSQSGITIGGWKTMVKGVTIDTFALGGDTAVEYDDEKLFLDHRRVIPLCMAASRYPQVTERLAELAGSFGVYSYPANQFFMLASMPAQMEKYTESEQKLIKALADGPLIYEDAAKAIGVSPYILKVGRLENEGVILRCGVTPTDVMHVVGDYTQYDAKASYLGIEYLHRVTKESLEGICRRIYDLAKLRLYQNLVRILMKYENGQELPASDAHALEKLTEQIFRAGRAGTVGGFRFVQPDFRANMRVVGIGAPSGIFVGDTAELLHAEAEVPEFAMVANAIGAAAGSVNSEHVVRIQPCSGDNSAGNYVITGGAEPAYFQYYTDAVKAAEALAEERACGKAREQGARGVLKTDVKVIEDHYDVPGEGSRLFLEAKVVARTKEL